MDRDMRRKAPHNKARANAKAEHKASIKSKGACSRVGALMQLLGRGWGDGVSYCDCWSPYGPSHALAGDRAADTIVLSCTMRGGIESEHREEAVRKGTGRLAAA